MTTKDEFKTWIENCIRGARIQGLSDEDMISVLADANREILLRLLASHDEDIDTG